MDYYNFHGSCQIPGLSEIYEEVFGKTSEGWFVECGAFDGFLYSNTWGLTERGWGGLFIEPIHSSLLKCVANHTKPYHPCVMYMESAVGNYNGTISLEVGGELTSGDPLTLESFKEAPWARGFYTGESVEVEIRTLDTILEQKNIHPNFELLCIDVEGMEYEVLRGFSINKYTPKLIIVEAHELDSDIRLNYEAPLINKYMEDAGYEKIFVDNINSIYLRKKG